MVRGLISSNHFLFQNLYIFTNKIWYKAMDDKPKRPIQLPEVVVKATRIEPKKYKTVTPSTKLYPNSSVANHKMDSISRANPALAKKIGSPVNVDNQMVYSPSQSDMIKRALK